MFNIWNFLVLSNDKEKKNKEERRKKNGSKEKEICGLSSLTQVNELGLWFEEQVDESVFLLDNWCHNKCTIRRDDDG